MTVKACFIGLFLPWFLGALHIRLYRHNPITWAAPNPFAGPPSIDNPDFYQAEEQCGGYWDDYTGSAYSWQSSNTAVATLPNPTLHTVAVGSATGSALNVLQASKPAPACPQQPFQGTQPVTVQKPTYFFSPSAVQTSVPPLCTQEDGLGYFIDISYYVADANSNPIKVSGMAPGENVGSGWNDSFAMPATTRNDGSFDDTPYGGCYLTTGHFCAAGHPQSFRLTKGTVFAIATNTTSRECTDGIQLVIQGNPTTPQNYNKTYTFGNIQ